MAKEFFVTKESRSVRNGTKRIKQIDGEYKKIKFKKKSYEAEYRK